eukprot:1161587-Pelagomonas_calceolata.AAC.9
MKTAGKDNIMNMQGPSHGWSRGTKQQGNLCPGYNTHTCMQTHDRFINIANHMHACLHARAHPPMPTPSTTCMHARTHPSPHPQPQSCMHAPMHTPTTFCMHECTHAHTHNSMHAHTKELKSELLWPTCCPVDDSPLCEEPKLLRLSMVGQKKKPLPASMLAARTTLDPVPLPG